MTAPAPLLDPADVDRLRAALGDFTVAAVHDLLGPAGQAAHSQNDLSYVRRVVRGAGAGHLATLVALFLLGDEVDESAARAALAPLALEAAIGTGLVEVSAGAVRARLDVRPYSEAGGTDPWWVVSDFGSDVRAGPLAADHVLGIGNASLTLAQATPRSPVGRALDLGTGSGIQALHLGRHADHVVATDISGRALRLAATSAALSGQHWDLRAGSLLEPVAGEEFDLVVANPPFVVSAGVDGYEYRDSGLAGDGVCQALLTGLPGVLAPGGTAQLLANWIVPDDGDWRGRLAGWLAGRGCDAWVWQREVAAPSEYATLWLRDAGEVPGTPRWNSSYDAWLDWFEGNRIVAVGMGLVTLWRSDAADPVLVLEDVPQAVEQPIGPELPAWISRQRWLAGTADADLLDRPLRAAPDLVRTTDALAGDAGWSVAAGRLRQSHGLRWEVEVDDAIAAVVAASTGAAPLRLILPLLAASLDAAAEDVERASLPIVRDLIGRGFLVPDELTPEAPA
ncbi:MAG TPA: methyltransferase [Jatrophihabitans sp.]|uniref:DUF7782 domain-containing protein n=1 Tax=Jatrophihabitans sp. TaxID=1932789 RepID=UPI002DFF9824|nr:methyltransferase [Jatrophihabitans sp.]